MADSDPRYRVGRSFIEVSDISFRLRGAEYHLGVVREIIEEEILGKPRDALSELSKCKMHWHAAAFFWELVATVETALQAVVAHHKLSIPRHDIKWRKVEQETQRAGIVCPLAEKLREVQVSDWFREANARRVYVTHWGPAFIQGLSSRGKVVSIKAANQINPVEVWTGYLLNMSELVETAVRILPGGHIRFGNSSD